MFKCAQLFSVSIYTAVSRNVVNWFTNQQLVDNLLGHKKHIYGEDILKCLHLFCIAG